MVPFFQTAEAGMVHRAAYDKRSSVHHHGMNGSSSGPRPARLRDESPPATDRHQEDGPHAEGGHGSHQ